MTIEASQESVRVVRGTADNAPQVVDRAYTRGCVQINHGPHVICPEAQSLSESLSWILR